MELQGILMALYIIYKVRTYLSAVNKKVNHRAEQTQERINRGIPFDSSWSHHHHSGSSGLDFTHSVLQKSDKF